jgi:hypothetical protein
MMQSRASESGTSATDGGVDLRRVTPCGDTSCGSLRTIAPRQPEPFGRWHPIPTPMRGPTKEEIECRS